MTTTFQAVFEGGVLRPAAPLPLTEGQSVKVTLESSNEPPALSDDELTEKIRSAKTFEEWFEATKLLPSDDGGYDILEALRQNRIWSGEYVPPK